MHAQILALGELRQEDYCELLTSLGYREIKEKKQGTERKEGNKDAGLVYPQSAPHREVHVSPALSREGLSQKIIIKSKERRKRKEGKGEEKERKNGEEDTDRERRHEEKKEEKKEWKRG